MGDWGGEGRGGGVMGVYMGLGGSYERVVVRGLAGDDYWSARLCCWMRTGWCFGRLARYYRLVDADSRAALEHLYYG